MGGRTSSACVCLCIGLAVRRLSEPLEAQACGSPFVAGGTTVCWTAYFSTRLTKQATSRLGHALGRRRHLTSNVRPAAAGFGIAPVHAGWVAILRAQGQATGETSRRVLVRPLEHQHQHHHPAERRRGAVRSRAKPWTPWKPCSAQQAVGSAVQAVRRCVQQRRPPVAMCLLCRLGAGSRMCRHGALHSLDRPHLTPAVPLDSFGVYYEPATRTNGAVETGGGHGHAQPASGKFGIPAALQAVGMCVACTTLDHPC